MAFLFSKPREPNLPIGERPPKPRVDNSKPDDTGVLTRAGKPLKKHSGFAFFMRSGVEALGTEAVKPLGQSDPDTSGPHCAALPWR